MGYCNFNLSEVGRKFHDEEWGVPVHDDRRLFEFLVLAVMQCGFTWEMILRKREVFRLAFDGFDFDRIAAYTDDDISRVLATPGMIHSLSKVKAIIGNAQVVRRLRAEHGSFSAFLWSYNDGRTIVYNGHAYLYLQTCGLVNDHSEDCPRFGFINGRYPTVWKRRDHEGEMQSTAAEVKALAALPPRKKKQTKPVVEPMWEFRPPEVIFRQRRVVFDRLEASGFRAEGKSFRYETPLLDGQFTLSVVVDERGTVKTLLVDCASGDEYVQHLVPAAAGAFVGRVRREFDDVLDRIDAACFVSKR